MTRPLGLMCVTGAVCALNVGLTAQGAPSVGSNGTAAGSGQEVRIALETNGPPCVGGLMGCSGHFADLAGFTPIVNYDARMLIEGFPHALKPPVPMVARLCDTRVLRVASNRQGTPACVDESRQILVFPRPVSQPPWSALSFTDKIYSGVDSALSQRRLSCYTIEWRSVETSDASAGRRRSIPDVRLESIPFELQKKDLGSIPAASFYGCR